MLKIQNKYINIKKWIKTLILKNVHFVGSHYIPGQVLCILKYVRRVKLYKKIQKSGFIQKPELDAFGLLCCPVVWTLLFRLHGFSSGHSPWTRAHKCYQHTGSFLRCDLRSSLNWSDQYPIQIQWGLSAYQNVLKSEALGLVGLQHTSLVTRVFNSSSLLYCHVVNNFVQLYQVLEGTDYRSTGFESGSWNWLSWLRLFMFSLSPTRRMSQ